MIFSGWSSRARPGPPEGRERNAALRRSCVQALGRVDWRDGALVGVARALLAVERALAGQGNLRINLLGALALPGWPTLTLFAIAPLLIKGAGDPEAAEIVALRKFLSGAPA